MHQYFNVIMGNFDGKVRKSYIPCVMKNGEKLCDGLSLMEQANLDSYFSLAVTLYLTRHDARVAWVGQYAQNVMPAMCSVSDIVEVPGFSEAWPGDNKELDNFEVMKLSDRVNWWSSYLMYTGGWVNLDKKQYVDMKKYISQAMYRKESEDMCINPLVLLTAVGNGLGITDYTGRDRKWVGTWAWNLIGFRDQAPMGFTEICPVFKKR